MNTKNVLPLRPVLFALAWLCAGLLPAHAATWYVSKQPGRADFTSLQAAVDAAAAGDTIFVEGHPQSYGELVIKKRLSIYGPGYFLLENLGLSAAIHPATVDSVYLNKDANGDAAGSILSGLTMGTTYVCTDQITLRRCHLTSVLYIGGVNPYYSLLTGDARNTFVTGCFSSHTGDAIVTQNTSAPGSRSFETVISNSVFLGGLRMDSPTDIPRVVQCSFSGGASGFVKNAQLSGNIFENGMSFIGCSVQNNVFATPGAAGGSTFTGSSSQSNVTASSIYDVFVTIGSTDGAYQLSATSVAKGAGPGGGDCGPFANGGYVLSGIPSLPVITSLQMPAEVSNRGSLPVTIQVRVQP